MSKNRNIADLGDFDKNSAGVVVAIALGLSNEQLNMMFIEAGKI